jgi:hypothetical protein
VTVLAVAMLTGAACGAPDGSARPTTPGPSGPTSLTPTTAGQPLARFAGFSAALYTRGENWLCGPDAATTDRCLLSNQDTTIVTADGRTQFRASVPKSNPGFDCFYVYPTMAFSANDLGMIRDTSGEENLVFHQAARLREQCRVYSPMYRHGVSNDDQALGYADVLDAFKHYMARWNGGRHVLFFGDGDGADHLTRLLQELFDGDAELQALLISAFLVGGHVDTAPGSRTGGTFRTIPACSTPTETGCVVGFAASSPATSRDLNARWGEAPAGRTRLCTNPAALGGGPAPLTAIVERNEDYLRTARSIDTPFLELPDVVTGECVTRGSITTMVLRPATDDPGDARAAPAVMAPLGQFGLHLTEVPLTMGSIMQLIISQTADLG